MADLSELSRLLSLVTFRADLNHVEGLDAFRSLLARDADGEVLRFLTNESERLEGRVRGGVAYAIAEHYLKAGDLGALQRLFATDDTDVKQSVLNALWGEPPASNPRMGPGIVALALEAARHPAPGVRTEACSVIQNQCAWGVNVSAAVEPLLSLLGDSSSRVRMQAACAVGNLAKRKYDVSQHVQALRLNLGDSDFFVRTWSAWALWELSRSRHDIGAAVADLVGLLASGREDDDDARRHAAGTLLHHARKSVDNGNRVRRCADGANLDASRRQVRRFQEQLAGVK
jgi:hypothetical protein